jgi:hypothetical protein
MIRTIQPIKTHARNPEFSAVTVYAEIISRTAFDKLRMYQLTIEEFYYQEYKSMVLNDQGEEEEKTFNKRVILIQPDGKLHKVKNYSFDEANYLANILDQMFDITEQGSDRRAKYGELGHLLVNNQEMVYNSTWELVTV